jgi:hypothetical protein
MGLELLDLQFQLERENHLSIDWHTLAGYGDPASPHGFDIRVGGFYRFITTHGIPLCRAKKCRYPLRSLSLEGICPECGTPYSIATLSWEAFVERLAIVLAVKQSQITPDAWLRQDLGLKG